jgi:hypothetical protein
MLLIFSGLEDNCQDIMANKIIKKKRMNESGASDLPMNKLILWIIAIIVLVCVAMVLMKPDIIYKWMNIVPDFLLGNKTIDYGPRGCLSGTTEIGFIAPDNYIVINEEKTNLYISESIIYADIEGADEEIAKIVKNYEIQLSNGGLGIVGNYGRLSLARYKDEVPDKEHISILGKGSISGSSICVKNEDAEILDKKKSCVLTCELMNGVCGDSPTEGMIYSGMDCLDKRKCYIKENEKKLESENLKIIDSYLTFYPDNYKKEESSSIKNLVNTDKLTISFASNLLFFTILNYKINGFCYSFDSNKHTTVLDYMDLTPNSEEQRKIMYEQGLSFRFNSNLFVYSDEKYMQFIAWEPVTMEKVLIRWKLNARDVIDTFDDNGKIIRDVDFYNEMSNAPDDSAFYIVLLKKYSFLTQISGTYVYSNVFKIIMKNNKIWIYAYNEDTGEFKLLDCSKGWFTDETSIDKISKTLTETLDKNCLLYPW